MSAVLPLAFCLLWILARSELVAVQVVSRHGTRAPDKIVGTICPNEKPNLERYANMSISLSGMTGRGQQEIYDLGVFTAQRYKSNGFLSKQYIQSEIYIRAVGSERTLQSAGIFANALYPADTRSTNYLADVVASVPYYSTPDTEDNLIEIRKSACAKKQRVDILKWDTEKGPKFWNDANIVDGLNEMCGTDIRESIKAGEKHGLPYTVGDAIKDICDAITFDDIEKFPPLPSWTEERFVRYSTVAADQLIERLYGTEAQIVYMNGDLPVTLLDNFEKSIGGKAKVKMWAYHGHREMSYALLKILDLDYGFLTRRGIPTAAIPAATTLFFELHKDKVGEWYVQTWVWSPCLKDARTGDEFHSLSLTNVYNCPAVLVHVGNCTENCPLKEWREIFEKKIRKTGTWHDLCVDTPMSAFSTQSFASEAPDFRFVSYLMLISVTAIVFYLLTKNRRLKYTPIPDHYDP